jgi:hypothetical protein
MRVVGAQQPRYRRVAEGIALGRKHPVCSQEMQDAAEGIGIGADRRGKFRSRSRRLVENIGDAEVGDDVQTPRQTIPPRDLQQCLKRIGFTHWLPPSIPETLRVSVICWLPNSN